MSLKTVEMQVALPRTVDAGKISEQLQQRSQLANDLAAAQNQKESDLKRTSVVKEERKAEAKLHRENHEQPNHQSSENQNRRLSIHKMTTELFFGYIHTAGTESET